MVNMFRTLLLRRLNKPIFSLSCLQENSIHTNTVRNTVLLFEREHEIKPFGTKRPFLEPQHDIYKCVGKELGPRELTVILTHDSTELGVSGEVVTLEKHIGRELIQDFKAVYASPENLEELASSLISKSSQTTQGRKVLLWLSTLDLLRCPMYHDVKWIMTPAVAARALQRAYNLVVSEDALELPDYPIESSNKDSWAKHDIKITVNNHDTVTKTIEIVPWIPSKKS